ncbi:hypothetical protein DQ04_00371120 [Trypanosoma grayi]|uniref:hypothetical protein n=1 Tax=Trypanosoma grayi TaxID=71804 RepID=UPI0004F47455|nr:hypothetical protein DQ04_00371120 [Trypanosoma grayi]KEG14626.1 hypothetical protein DQ04_00371120 [Trypanosoma grayi]
MTSKEEVAALMAHGDTETKISLLKKAVVSVTKQKQVLEQHNKQLRDQMGAIGEELSRVEDDNKTLRRKLQATETELEAERKRRHFGASVKTTWKGLSSLVTGADGEESGTAAKRPKGMATTVNLSPEDQEKIVAENESIHIQLYEVQTKYENERRRWEKENEQQTAEKLALQAEVMELRSLLNSTAHACDHLNVECTRQAALAQFCHHFFVLSWDATAQQQQQHLRVTVSPSLMAKRGGVPPREIREELAAGTLAHSAAFVRTIMSGVSVLIASLRDALGPQVKAATLGDIRCYRDRLSTLLEAHGARKLSVLFHVKEMEEAFAASVAPDAKLTQLLHAQGLLFTSLDEWLALLCEHARLLIDACVIVENGDAGDIAGGRRAVIEPSVCNMVRTLAAIRGSLEVLTQLCSDSCTVLRNNACDSAEWLLALERFWWEGCVASSTLQQAAVSLSHLLQELASAATSDPVRVALKFIKNSLGSFTAGDTAVKVSREKTAELSRPLEDLPAVGNSALADSNELVAALAAADRAAVCYHTQMNFTLLELAEKQDALAGAQQEVRRLESLNQQQAEDAERVQEALETQIRLLSDQLVECTANNNNNNNNGNRKSW